MLKSRIVDKHFQCCNFGLFIGFIFRVISMFLFFIKFFNVSFLKIPIFLNQYIIAVFSLKQIKMRRNILENIWIKTITIHFKTSWAKIKCDMDTSAPCLKMYRQNYNIFVTLKSMYNLVYTSSCISQTFSCLNLLKSLNKMQKQFAWVMDK